MKRGVYTQAEINGTDMWRDESLQRFIEGLKLSASCAKELEVLLPNQGWGMVVEQLKHIIVSGTKLARTGALSRQALLQHADEMAKRMDTSR